MSNINSKNKTAKMCLTCKCPTCGYKNETKFCDEYYVNPCYYGPERKQKYIQMIRKLLTETETIRGTENKEAVGYRIYEWTSKNLWFMTTWKKYGKTVQDKLREFENNHEGSKITNDFGWMIDMDLNKEYKTCTKSGRKIKSPVRYITCN